MTERNVRVSTQVPVDLTDDEVRLLRLGLSQWGGAATSTEEMAVAMGFTSVGDLDERGDRLRAALQRREPLTRADWGRALLATEIAFASDVIGSGRDWSIVTGFTDVESLALLRQIQQKLTRLASGAVGSEFGTYPDGADAVDGASTESDLGEQ